MQVDTITKHFHAQKVLSYGAIYNFIESNRNYGKTWGFNRRAKRRAEKRGKKTIWVRRYTKEAKEACDAFFNSKDLLKFCGLEWYDKDTKKGNLKQKGRKFYIKRGKRWEWFIHIIALCEAKNVRSVDDVDVDTIVFDEYTTTPEKYKFYRGNEVEDFIDTFFSTKREHVVRCYFLGNKESHVNPYFNYFQIPELPDTWEGIKTFRNGSIALQRINNKQNKTNDKNGQNEKYDKQLIDLFKNTKYGDYIYKSKTKTTHNIKIGKAVNGSYYTQLFIDGQYLTINIASGNYYVKRGYNKSLPTYCLQDVNIKNHFILTKRLRKYFIALENAFIDGRIYYTSQAVYEYITPFYKWLTII